MTAEVQSFGNVAVSHVSNLQAALGYGSVVTPIDRGLPFLATNTSAAKTLAKELG
jgi:hypothetical protein